METIFRGSVEVPDVQSTHSVFEYYAMAHGYASTGTLFAHFLLPRNLEIMEHDAHESPTYTMQRLMREMLHHGQVAHAKTIIYKGDVTYDSVTHEPVWFLKVSKRISIDNGVTLEPGGILVVSANYSAPAVEWPGMTKWFMADRSTLLFTCNIMGSGKSEVCIGEVVCLSRSYLGVLYIPPSPQPPPMITLPLLSTPLTFKQWLTTPDFTSTTRQKLMDMYGASKCAVSQEELDYFAMDYQSHYADMIPSLLSQEAVDEYISLHTGTFNLTHTNLFNHIWKLWMKTHTAEMQAESALFKKWVLGNRRTNYLHFHGPVRDMRTALHEIKKRFLNQKRKVIQNVLMKRVAGIGNWIVEYIIELVTANYR